MTSVVLHSHTTAHSGGIPSGLGMVRRKRETCGKEPQIRTQIDTLVILDREVDLISTLPTQLTYECASVRLPEDKSVPISSQEEL